MSKTTTNQDLEVELDDVYEQEIADDDFGFIVGPDGELKSVFLPDNMSMDELPENIQKIFELFGIDDPDRLENTTIH